MKEKLTNYRYFYSLKKNSGKQTTVFTLLGPDKRTSAKTQSQATLGQT